MFGRKVIKIEKLFKKFSKHVASCKSAWAVCNLHAAFESWFRVELYTVLRWKLGFKNIRFKYSYPDSIGGKADLWVDTRPNGDDIVLELKSFVKDEDANKKNKLPKQIKKLERLICEPNGVLQVLTFITFINYPLETTMRQYMEEFGFGGSWEILGPRRLIKKYPLYVAITSMTK